MIYKNERLNIQIENAQFFEVVERGEYVELKNDGRVAFEIFKNSTVYASGSSTVHAFDSSTVRAYDSSTVHAYDSSTVRAYDSSTVRAFDSSTVRALDSSTVHAYNSSTVHASGFSVIFKKSVKCRIDTHNHFGSVISQVFKTKSKMRVYKKLGNGAIAELEIPRGKVFQSENHGKCRTESAKVISITSVDGQTNYTEGYSDRDPKFMYRVGGVVRADYDPEIEECSTGIHFFLTRREAEEYEL